jgi:hypothetical protein
MADKKTKKKARPLPWTSPKKPAAALADVLARARTERDEVREELEVSRDFWDADSAEMSAVEKAFSRRFNEVRAELEEAMGKASRVEKFPDWFEGAFKAVSWERDGMFAFLGVYQPDKELPFLLLVGARPSADEP